MKQFKDSLRSNKGAFVYVVLGTSLGILIGMNLSPVTADYEAEIHNSLLTLNNTLESIDDKLRVGNHESVLRKIASEIDDVETAIRNH